MSYLIVHEATNREFTAPAVNFHFCGNVEGVGGVISSRFCPVDGVEVRELFNAPESVRAAFRTLLNASGRGFRQEYAVPGKGGWYSIEY